MSKSNYKYAKKNIQLGYGSFQDIDEGVNMGKLTPTEGKKLKTLKKKFGIF